MTEMSCKEIEQMLVDYADGQLSPGQSSEVAEHLAQCQRCNDTLKALQRSLRLAGVIWQGGLADTETIRVGISARCRWAWQRYAAIVAVMMLIVWAAFHFRAQRHRDLELQTPWAGELISAEQPSPLVPWQTIVLIAEWRSPTDFLLPTADKMSWETGQPSGDVF